jgi:lipid-A-disaccharide synthase
MFDAVSMLRRRLPQLRARVVLPNEALVRQAKSYDSPGNVQIEVDGLAQWMKEASIALASTGTVTMECANHGLPTVAMYKTSWTNYQVGKRLVKVKYLAMPNLLANELVFPEFVQDHATPENLATAALSILQDERRQAQIRARLEAIIASFGPPGASRRAAQAIVRKVAKRN